MKACKHIRSGEMPPFGEIEITASAAREPEAREAVIAKVSICAFCAGQLSGTLISSSIDAREEL